MSHIKIHNIETGEIIEREMTDVELAQLEADKKIAAVETAAKVEALTKRQLLLDRLGITEEEAKLLLG